MKKRPESWCLYRTKWLMAHNIMHELRYKKGQTIGKAWDRYLKELKTAEKVACTPA